MLLVNPYGGVFAAAAAFHVVAGVPEVPAVDVLVAAGVPSLVGVLDVDSFFSYISGFHASS
jgi:hypothetical protein